MEFSLVTSIPIVPSLVYISGGWHLLLYGIRERGPVLELLGLLLPESLEVATDEGPDLCGATLTYVEHAIGSGADATLSEESFHALGPPEPGDRRLTFVPGVLVNYRPDDPEAEEAIDEWNATIRERFQRTTYPEE